MAKAKGVPTPSSNGKPTKRVAKKPIRAKSERRPEEWQGYTSRSIPVAPANGQRCLSADQVGAAVVDWLLPSRIPFGLVTMLTGESEAGKSVLLGALAAAFTRGETLGTSTRQPPGRVLVFSPEEDPYHTLRPRWETQGADLSRIHLGDYAPDGQLLGRLILPADLRRLGYMIGSMGVRLVIIDPITAYLASAQAVKDDVEVRQLLDGLQQIAGDTQAAFIITRHYRKSRDGSPLDRVGGSAAWTQFPRVVLACGRDPDDNNQRVLAVGKNNLRHGVPSIRFSIEEAGAAVKLVLGSECSVSAESMGLGCTSEADRDAMADAVAFLLDTLKDGEKPAKDVVRTAQDSGMSLGTLRRAKVKLRVTSHPIGPNGQRYIVWRLPCETPPE